MSERRAAGPVRPLWRYPVMSMLGRGIRYESPEALRLSLAFVSLALTACGSRSPTPESIAEARRRVIGPPRSIVFARDSVAVPLIGAKMMPLVHVRLNGRGPYRLLVDTGANVTLLQGRVARELRLPVLRPGEKSQLVELRRLEIGASRFADVVAGARDWSEDIDGVLGFNLFADCLLTFDYPARTLILARGSLPPPDGSDRVAFELNESRHPFVEVAVGETRIRFLLDTGATQWLTVPKTVAQSLRLDGAPRPGPTLTSNGESYPSEVARLGDDVRIGAYKLTRPEVLLTPDEFPLMGSGFLRHFRLTIDQASRIVEFSRPSKDPIEGP